MKLRTIKRVLAMFLVNKVLAGTHAFGAKSRLLNSIGYEVGEGTRIVGPLRCTGHLTIGRDCWVGRDFVVEGNGSVTIGDRCDVAPSVTFLTGGHAIGAYERRAGTGESYSIAVGDGIWIGARATIVRSVSIGEGCVIAACSCVERDVPDDVLVGGVPARVIRSLES